MKIPGFILLLAGWLIVLAALIILGTPGARAVFIIVGLAVQIVGLVLVTRAHPRPRGFEY